MPDGNAQGRSYEDLTDQDPYAFYDGLLAAPDGVVWDEKMQAWLVASYDVCQQILLQDDVGFAMPERINRETLAPIRGGARGITELNGSEHVRMHAWWLKSFAPRHIGTWRNDFLKEIVGRGIDRFIAAGQADLAAALAPYVPIRAMAAVMDLPWRDDAWVDELYELNEQVIQLYGAVLASRDKAGAADVRATAIEASERLNALLTPIILERQNGEGDDIISRLWRDGPELLEGFGLSDMLPNVRMMIQGGADTTVHGVRNAAYLLLSRPELRETLTVGGDEAIAAFVEEVLRLHGPVHFRSRQAIKDVQIGSHHFKSGEAVIPLIAAANRDRDQFACPHAVDLKRQGLRRHFAFHHGARLCVGAALARAELIEVVGQLLTRLPDMRLDPAGPEPQFKGRLLRSYRPLPIVFTPRETR